MIDDIATVLRKTARMLLFGRAPAQLALGFTLGMLIGLIPKSNLLALALCVLLFSLRCNKALALAAAILFSFAAHWTDPFAHKLGLLVLGVDSLQPTFAALLAMPLGPWIGFNNTVVTGSLLVGLYTAYPVYWVTRQLAAAGQSLFGTKTTVSRPATHPAQPRAAA